jgi:hypothetical protein
MSVTTARQTSVPTPGRVRGRGSVPSQDAIDQLEQLRFLHEVARLATTARTWDELLETVVDRTRDVLHADVSSLYLLDRDGAYLTLAATNGLDRFQIGRARVPYSEGVTGRVAATAGRVIPDVKADDRFLWVRGIDQRRFVASMLSVPLTGTTRSSASSTSRPSSRAFSDHDVAQLGASPTCWPGSSRRAVSNRRRRRGSRRSRRSTSPQRAHRPRHPRAADAARHRAAPADLLADEPPLRGQIARHRARATRAQWHRATLEQIERLDRLVDSILVFGAGRPGGAGGGHPGRSRCAGR